ncbi:MAG: right-handed parallel beta-helix repeat-containing protein, partial [Candidatus Omnitrophica bacterium]|nr:right-handed parallel beta-helix repeat-containing protein [Candidatus Omnitrophota bacterium]
MKKNIIIFISGILCAVIIGYGYKKIANNNYFSSLYNKVTSKMASRGISLVARATSDLLIADFNTDEAVRAWQLGNVQGELSSEYPTSGSTSMKLTFFPGKDASYAKIEKYFADHKELANWSGHEVLTMDIYNLNPERERMLLQIKDTSDEKLKIELYLEPNANNHIEVGVHQLSESLNTSSIKQLELFLWGNQAEKIFFIDNVRLLSQNTIRKNSMNEPLPVFEDNEITNVLAESFKNYSSGSRWWDELEIKNLCVVKDLKQSFTGRDLYVDCNKGSDLGDGSVMSPWRTISRAVQGLRPGDTLIIGAGRYRENINFSCAGTVDQPILIGPRGNGEVVIDASTILGEWQPHSNSISKVKCPEKPIAVVVDNKPLLPEFSLERVNQETWYYDEKEKLLYLSLPGENDPAKHEIGVIADSEKKDAIFLNHARYVTLYGLTVKFSNGKGIKILGDHNKVIKCNIAFNGSHGITTFSYGNTIATDTHIIKNNIYHNAIRNWPRGNGEYKGGGWDVGATGHSAANTYYIGNIVNKNGGEGLAASGKRSIFYDNIVMDNYSVNIYI